MEAPVMSGMFRALVLGLLVLFSLAASQAAAQGNSEAGIAFYKTQNCMECHGDEGKGDGFVLPLLKVKVQMNDWTDKAAMSQLTDEYLAEIYGWFTEGFDTKDLQEAKALLQELA